MEENKDQIKNTDTITLIDDLSRLLLLRRKMRGEDYLQGKKLFGINITKNSFKEDGEIEVCLKELMLQLGQKRDNDQLVCFFVRRWCGPFLNEEYRKKINTTLNNLPEPGLIRVKEAIKSLQENYLFFTDTDTHRRDLQFNLPLVSPLEQEILKTEVKLVSQGFELYEPIRKQYPHFSIESKISGGGGIDVILSK